MKPYLIALALLSVAATASPAHAVSDSLNFEPRKLRFLERCFLPTDDTHATGFVDDKGACVPWMPSVWESSFEGDADAAPSDIEL